jgi:dephospho-CoA kinase
MLPDWQSHVIVVTGTIGSGKSTVTELLQKLGAFCVSADVLARRSLEPGSAGLAAVVKEFGPGVLNPDGALNRRKLGEIVFGDPARRKVLEAITHPIIADMAGEEFSQAVQDKSAEIFVYECPLLFETGLDKTGFKKIVLVTVQDETCIARIMQRDGLDREQAEKRLQAQLPVQTKSALSDIVIDNSGTRDELESKIKALLASLK